MVKKRGLDKRAQHTMALPFGLIFSIILIVVFIVIAFIAVKYFLDIGRCSEVGLFYNNFQDKIKDTLQTQKTEDEFEINLPSGISKICFANFSAEITNNEDYEQIKDFYLSGANVFLLPPEKACDIPYKFIQHLNIKAITSNKNPYCADVSRDLKIKKGFYDKSVVVE